MKKFKGKYRIPSARLQTWDYGNNGAYFLTLCTHNRETYFGNIEDGNMLLSEMGQIAQKHWNEIPEHFPFVILDEFIVMPNHVHGIIIIDKPDGNQY
jgi:REP element-mobilizing transposase RayT